MILRYYGRVRPQIYDQVTQHNEQIKSGIPFEDFLSQETPENQESAPLGAAQIRKPLKGDFCGKAPENTEPKVPLRVAQKASQHTAARGGTERQDDSEEPEPNSYKALESRYLAARNGNGRHLAETSHFALAERTGFEPAEPLTSSRV